MKNTTSLVLSEVDLRKQKENQIKALYAHVDRFVTFFWPSTEDTKSLAMLGYELCIVTVNVQHWSDEPAKIYLHWAVQHTKKVTTGNVEVCTLDSKNGTKRIAEALSLKIHKTDLETILLLELIMPVEYKDYSDPYGGWETDLHSDTKQIWILTEKKIQKID